MLLEVQDNGPGVPDAMKQHIFDRFTQGDEQLGAVARPAMVRFVGTLPKTRSGKLLRRSIQALAEGRDPGDLTTIEDPAALEQLQLALSSKAA